MYHIITIFVLKNSLAIHYF